jgi:hypothetical protein
MLDFTIDKPKQRPYILGTASDKNLLIMC